MLGKIERKKLQDPFLIPKIKETISERPGQGEWQIPQVPVCKCCGNRDLKFSGKLEGNRFWRCDDCEFVFAEQAEKTSFNKSTQKNNTKSIQLLSPALTWLPPTKLHILDLGCGDCNIDKRLRKVGHEVVKINVTPPSQLSDRFTSEVLNLNIPEQPFDFIYSYDLFEYLPNPMPVLRKLCRLLNENGLLLINSDMEAANKAFDEIGNAIPSNRCSYYSHRTFEKMLNRVDFNIIYKNPAIIIARQE